MTLSIVLKEEYRPSLPELLSPGWQRLPRLLRALILIAGLAFLAALVGLGLTFENASISYSGPVSFSFEYRDLHRVTPAPGGYAKIVRYRDGRLQESFEVDPLHLQPYIGEQSTAFTLYTVGYVDRLRHTYPDFVWEGEGKTEVNPAKVNSAPAYDVFFSAMIDGERMYGRDVFILPQTPGARNGVDIRMLVTPTADPELVSLPLEIGEMGTLSRPLHSLTLE